MDKLIEEFSVGLFFWQTILFLILIIVLRIFAWKPILNAVEAREKGIEDALLEAKKAREEMANLKAENEKIKQQARAERDEMLKEARSMRDKTVESAKEIARAEADKIISDARETIQSEKNAAVEDIRKQVANLSIEVAEKVLKEKMQSENQQKELINKLITEIKLS